MAKRGQKISKAILLLLDQAVEPIELGSLPYRVSKFSRHLFPFEQKFRRPQVRRALLHLAKSGFVEKAIEGERENIILTEKGRQRAKKYRIDSMITKKPKHWDGKWRMIVFDIPEADRAKRDAVRNKLKQLNFYKLQESIWIYPYDCRQAVSHLVDYYDLRGRLHFAIVDVFDEEDEARRYFGIRESALPYEAEHKKLRLDFHPQHPGA